MRTNDLILIYDRSCVMNNVDKIEKIYVDLTDNTNVYIEDTYELSKDLVRLNYCKISDDLVVIPKEEYDELKRKADCDFCITETKKELLYKLKSAINKLIENSDSKRELIGDCNEEECVTFYTIPDYKINKLLEYVDKI